jgi:hypothetical protein
MKVLITAIAITLLATANAENAPSSSPKLPPSNRVCDYQSKGYFFSALRTQGADSRAYCQSVGAELVSVDNSNFADLTQMIVKCLGPEQKAWVNSWDGNTFADSPLAIWTGLQSGSGSINININNEPLFGICSVRRRGLSRPEPRPLIASGISQSEDDASSATPEVEFSSFTVPGFGVLPSEFPSTQIALFAENIDLNDAFGINSIAEDVIEDNLAENVAEEQEEEEEVISEEEAFEEEEKVEEEEYENEIVEDAEPVSVESNIQSIAPQLFENNLNI